MDEDLKVMLNALLKSIASIDGAPRDQQNGLRKQSLRQFGKAVEGYVVDRVTNDLIKTTGGKLTKGMGHVASVAQVLGMVEQILMNFDKLGSVAQADVDPTVAKAALEAWYEDGRALLHMLIGGGSPVPNLSVDEALERFAKATVPAGVDDIDARHTDDSVHPVDPDEKVVPEEGEQIEDDPDDAAVLEQVVKSIAKVLKAEGAQADEDEEDDMKKDNGQPDLKQEEVLEEDGRSAEEKAQEEQIKQIAKMLAKRLGPQIRKMRKADDGTMSQKDVITRLAEATIKEAQTLAENGEDALPDEPTQPLGQGTTDSGDDRDSAAADNHDDEKETNEKKFLGAVGKMIEAEFAKLAASDRALAERLDELAKATPAPGKGVIRSLSKAADIAGEDGEDKLKREAERISALPEEKREEELRSTLFKSVFAAGGRPLNG